MIGCCSLIQGVRGKVADDELLLSSPNQNHYNFNWLAQGVRENTGFSEDYEILHKDSI